MPQAHQRGPRRDPHTGEPLSPDPDHGGAQGEKGSHHAGPRKAAREGRLGQESSQAAEPGWARRTWLCHERWEPPEPEPPPHLPAVEPRRPNQPCSRRRGHEVGPQERSRQVIVVGRGKGWWAIWAGRKKGKRMPGGERRGGRGAIAAPGTAPDRCWGIQVALGRASACGCLRGVEGGRRRGSAANSRRLVKQEDGDMQLEVRRLRWRRSSRCLLRRRGKHRGTEITMSDDARRHACGGIERPRSEGEGWSTIVWHMEAGVRRRSRGWGKVKRHERERHERGARKHGDPWGRPLHLHRHRRLPTFSPPFAPPLLVRPPLGPSDVPPLEELRAHS
ncbi:uncharacterized protein A4U43_C10F14520 [Asparagus officinalis]|uniref:Uncharacterized protein n=1 Tax=Asparagus officinalis TaxID=4686 RepID=A0A5P1E306_ASPOF|nr:uncharacterized protein A4U43_C10F14520 [Asparagus officinalis]